MIVVIDLQEWKVSPQALFGYIQYQAYKGAVLNAEQANKRAMYALVFGGISAISAILTSVLGAF